MTDERAAVGLSSEGSLASMSVPIDVGWAVSHACDVLAVSCCETDGSYLIWDRRTGRLTAAGGC